jgi:hypothetical protein
MTVSQADKAKKFRALHEAPGSFVIANPWDGGSARVLAGLGFEALATSSGAKAGVLGKRDGKVSREEALANAAEMQVDGLSARVFTAEYLAAIALQTGRAKDKARLLQFIEAHALDRKKFEELVERHQLGDKWRQFQKQFPSNE